MQIQWSHHSCCPKDVIWRLRQISAFRSTPVKACGYRFGLVTTHGSRGTVKLLKKFIFTNNPHFFTSNLPEDGGVVVEVVEETSVDADVVAFIYIYK